MKKKLYIRLVALLLCGMLLTPAAAFASTQEEITANLESVDALTNAIEEAYADEAVSEETVQKLMDDFNSLPDSAKVNVSNYDKLEKLSEKFSVTGTPSGDDPIETYTFTVTEDVPTVSIVATIPDGSDRPVFTLVSPSGAETQVNDSQNAVQGNEINVGLTWTDTFVQFDVNQSAAGDWTINSTVPVIFKEIEYAGAVSEFEEEKSEDTETEEPDEEPQEEATGSGLSQAINFIKKAWLPVILLVLAILMKIRMQNHDSDGNKKTKKNKKKAEPQDIVIPAVESPITDSDDDEKLKMFLSSIEDSYEDSVVLSDLEAERTKEQQLRMEKQLEQERKAREDSPRSHLEMFVSYPSEDLTSMSGPNDVPAATEITPEPQAERIPAEDKVTVVDSMDDFPF